MISKTALELDEARRLRKFCFLLLSKFLDYVAASGLGFILTRGYRSACTVREYGLLWKRFDLRREPQCDLPIRFKQRYRSP